MNRGSNRDRHRLRPALQVLEDRRLPATFTVTSPADTLTKEEPTAGTLRWAIQQAEMPSSGGASTINFQLGGAAATITLTQGELVLDDTSASITIDGPGATLLSISGKNASRVFDCTSGTTSISGLTITGGLSKANGGGLYNGSASTLSVSYCTISGSSSEDSGGGLYNDGMATLDNCTVSGNSAPSSGGLYNNGTEMLSVSDCTIKGNSAQGGGGLGNGGTATLDGCTISGNSVAHDGGGLFNLDSATLTSCTISGNSAADGGGVENSAGTAKLEDCTIKDDLAAKYGGGLYNLGMVTVDGGTISGNSAKGGVGGLDNGAGATLNVSNCTISGNSDQFAGGGLGNGGMATLDDCTISGNSTLAGGGGLDNGPGATLSVSGCTIAGNTGGFGGGLANEAMATVDECTISGNSAVDYGGGLYNSAGATTLTDTIVASNLSGGGADLGGLGASGVTGTHNLIGTGGSGGIQGGSGGNIVLTSLNGLGLAPLGNYGGPTQTIALLPGSPALGAGTPIQGTTTDQRGGPIGSSVDIGAFQSQGFTLTPDGGGATQGAAIDASFPLAFTVTANNPDEPVAGGVVTFNVTPGPTGASATLSGASAIIGTDGVAQVTATSNGAIGPYVVTATAAGASPTQIRLDNIPAISRIFLFPFLFHRRKKEKVASIGLEVEIQSTFPGGVAPTGTVTFMLGHKTLGTAMVVDGEAMLTVKSSRVLNKEITVAYTGDADFLSSALVPPVLTRKSLKSLAGPMDGVLERP